METHTNPFSGLVSSLDVEEFEELQEAVGERRCREKIGVGTLEEAIGRYRSHPMCPSCGGPTTKNGKTPTGRQRYQCQGCGKRFSALTGTIFEYGKKGLPTWVDFITLMCYNAPIRLIVEMCGIAQTKCTDEAHRADTKDPVYLECMEMVNNLCSWIKRFLWGYTGMTSVGLKR